MPQPSLEGVLLKLNRAAEHAHALNHEIGQFLATNPYEVTDDFDPEARKHTYRVRERASPPSWLGVIVGDCVHNLRSALDQLIYQLALGRKDSPGRKTAFPVFIDAGTYRKQRRRIIGDLDPKAQQIVDDLQPGGDNPTFDPLYVLHELWNEDKHRLIPLVASSAVSSEVSLPPGVGIEEIEVVFRQGPLEGEEVIGWFVMPKGMRPDQYVHPDFAFDVALPRDGPAHGAPVRQELHRLGQATASAVERFRPFFPP